MWPHLSRRAAITGLCAGLISFAAWGQARVFEIPKGDLSKALDAYASQSGLALLYSSADMHGITSAGVHGQLDAVAALNALLARTGFSAKRTGSIVAIVRSPAIAKSNAPANAPSAPASTKPRTLQEVSVTATAEGLAAMRVPTPLRQIPQSVTVISRDTLDQQNARELIDVLNRTTGITVVQNDSEKIFYFSRGFQIKTIHMDGGAAVNLTLNAPKSQGAYGNYAPDLAEVDHVEVLRGSDALFGGLGSPSATVNLVRKQPLPDFEGSLAVSLGSWNSRRLEADLTGPLTKSGDLRGRLVVVDQSRDYFYQLANRKNQKLYASVAYDPSSDTTLTLGGSTEHQHGLPASGGLPRYENGADLKLPRSQAFALPWNRNTIRLDEAFAQLEHHFDDAWKINASASAFENQSAQKSAEFGSPIFTGSQLAFAAPSALENSDRDQQSVADVTLTGSFEAWNRKQDVIAGIDFQHEQVGSKTYYFPSYTAPFDPFAFDPFLYPEPTDRSEQPRQDIREASFGAYAALRVRPWDGW